MSSRCSSSGSDDDPERSVALAGLEHRRVGGEDLLDELRIGERHDVAERGHAQREHVSIKMPEGLETALALTHDPQRSKQERFAGPRRQ
jgi:hypothetical protein